MTEYSDRMLALLDQGAKDAEIALTELRALWVREDEATAANRALILAAHDQGARDREEARKMYAGVPVVPEPEPEPAPRMSTLPVTPLAALEQPMVSPATETKASD